VIRAFSVVLRKELRETLRDPRTLFVTYGFPLLFYPIVTLWGGEAAAIRLQKQRDEQYRVAVAGDLPARAAQGLAAIPRMERVELPPADEKRARELSTAKDGEKLRALLQAHNLQALVASEPAGESPLGQINRVAILHFDDSDPLSLRAAELAADKLREAATELNAGRLRELGIDAERVDALRLERRGVAGSGRLLGRALATAAPFLLFLILALSAYYPALNATVGERERGTWITLQTAGARPLAILSGKVASVTLASLAGALAYALSLAACAWFLVRGAADGASPGPLPGDWAWLPLIAAPVALLLAALAVALGSVARRVAEGQAYLSVFMLVILFPPAAASLAELAASPLVSAVPLLNAAVLLNRITAEAIAPAHVLIAAVSNALAAVAALGVAAHAWRAEYLGPAAPLSAAGGAGAGAPAARRVTPAVGGLLFAGILALVFHLNLALARSNIFLLLALTHLGVMVLLPVLACLRLKLPLRETFRLRRAPGRAWIAAALLAVAAPFAAAYWIPVPALPKELAEDLLKKLAAGGADRFPWLAWLGMALLPGLCEELFFRGLLFASLRSRLGATLTVAATACLFGLIHLSWVRFLPTASMGVLLGLLALGSGSVLPGMLTHAAYNSLLLLGTLAPGLAAGMGIIDGRVPRDIGLAATALLALGLGVLALGYQRQAPFKSDAPQ
jgi:sodium transport system permease protein